MHMKNDTLLFHNFRQINIFESFVFSTIKTTFNIHEVNSV